MDCNECRREISRLVDGESTREGMELLGKHLEECAGCRSFRDSVSGMARCHESLVDVQPPASILDGIMAGVGRRTADGWVGRWFGRAVLPVLTAAVLILGVMIGGFLRTFLLPDGENGSIDVLRLEYLTEYPPESVGDIVIAAAAAVERGETDE